MWRRFRQLPVSHTAVIVKDTLWQFLLEGMFADFVFVNLDPQPGFGVRSNTTALGLKRETMLRDIVAPGHIRMDRFTDNI